MDTLTTIDDAEADIAALVYGSDDRPDLVLQAFACEVAASGRRVCGLIQMRDHKADDIKRKVLVLDAWDVVDVNCEAAANGEARCFIDGQWLGQLAAGVQASIRQGVDVVIVNRFGSLEAAGRGFCGAIKAASETETPLIIAVPEWEFERWTRFSSGMTVRLTCSLDQVMGWWQRVMLPSPQALVPSPRACELLK